MPSVQDIRRQSETDEPLTMLTAYDAPTAGIVDEMGIDMILVGDSVGNAMLGYDSTMPVTMEQMASHTGAVVRGADDALVVADLPFLAYGVDMATSIENAGRLIKEEGADAVKVESGPHTVDLTERLVEVGIPVMAHLGLSPQRVKQVGGYGRQATDKEGASELLDLAIEHEAAGAFATVVEHVPANVAETVTDELEIPTIGIGAGPATDGQILVIPDVIGLSDWSPPFAKQFGDVKGELETAISGFRQAVEDGEFPGEEHTHIEEGLLE